MISVPAPANAGRHAGLALIRNRKTFALLMMLVGSALAVASEVAVDVGHGIIDQGAISARGKSEYLFNDRLARRLAGELPRRGLKVRPINFDGRIESLPARPQQAAGTDFFISIHHDSVQPHLLRDWQWQGTPQTYSDDHAGFALFVSHDNPDLPTSLRCASAIGARLRRLGFVPARHHDDPSALKPRPAADADNAVYYYDKLVVLYKTTLPAVLFEAGVIKNRDEERLLDDPDYQGRMADAIATGIAACLYAGS
ncbi:MAG TPA: N-acetylmuramoyl-L-alanine amidase [Accumulibacter sp.]|nr:N-acetylmuramoyl-L-alanine amidase [Accumulibacter sp.]HNG38092.1 N-acetylmuramoyl-L-alanine amidase [Accumulibacter sp.]HNH24137.1 N-acetylmuramoyl-L-alanine amidase [Accumulibacter sp.]HNL13145.1 N-acetylmuramoyl-L-alanine amidase [Accumulibacter sp.]HNM75390.1 N-acetylmuramoyl-L-alanine amidase [Accumulibacter sp.]